MCSSGRRGGQVLPSQADEGADMEESWHELWEDRRAGRQAAASGCREELDEQRLGDMLERFFQNYERVTGGLWPLQGA